MLGLQRRMGSYLVLRAARRTGEDQVAERRCSWDATKAAGPPLPQVILYSLLTWFAKQSPGLPARTRHHGYVRKLVMGVLGAITSAQRSYNPNNLPTLFEACADERSENQVGYERVRGNEDMGSWNHNWREQYRQS